jgi:hypothetical protein
MFDFLRIAVAILPLAAYTNVIGLLRLRTHPTVLSGTMDIVLLGLAMIGIIAIGPIELFFPRAAYSLMGVWVWGVLIALYFFTLMLCALNTAPRLIVYGLDSDSLRSEVCSLLEKEQIRSEWLGDVCEMPELGVRVCVEAAGKGKISQLHAVGREQNLTGWLTLERLLVDHVSKLSILQRRESIMWLNASVLLFAVAIVLIANDLPRLQQAMAQVFDIYD